MAAKDPRAFAVGAGMKIEGTVAQAVGSEMQKHAKGIEKLGHDVRHGNVGAVAHDLTRGAKAVTHDAEQAIASHVPQQVKTVASDLEHGNLGKAAKDSVVGGVKAAGKFFGL